MRGWVAGVMAGVAAAWAMLAAAPASAEWREASSDHFVIYADASDKWLRDFAERLERFDSGMRLLLNMPQQATNRSNRLTIYVLPTQDAVKKMCGRCGEVAGFYVPRAGGSVAYTLRGTRPNSRDETSDFVLFHEYTHHFLLENFPAAYARWFNEGFAEFYSTFTVAKNGATTFGRVPQHRGYGLLNAGPIPIETLLDPRGKRLSSMQMDIFYGRAWLLTHMLTFEASRKGQMNAYLRMVSAGKSSLDAAKEAFGDLKTLQRDMDRYLNRSRFAGLGLPPDKTKVGAIAIRVLTTGEAETMQVRMQSDRGVTLAQARALLPEARKRAGRHPTDAGAQVVLAEAEYDAGYDVEAEAAADRAIAASPKNRDALLYKGRALVRRAQVAQTRDAATWKTARGWFVRANRGDPDAAEPLMLFYTSFLAEGAAPSETAILGLERAFELSPHDASLRMLLVRQALIESRTKLARGLLLPLANDPHASSEDNPAAKMVAMIDEGTKGPAIAASIGREGEIVDAEDEKKDGDVAGQ